MIALYVLSIIFIISPFFPATNFKHWFFRTPDFVRLQSIVIQLIILIILLVSVDSYSYFDYAILLSLTGSMLYQLVKIFPYTKLNTRLDKTGKSDGMVSILAVNVLQTNTDHKKLIDIIKKYNPDIVLTMETNKVWEDALSEIEEDYKHSIKVPLENLYGMHVYSKNKLNKTSVQFQVEDQIPSIYFNYAINTNTDVFFACLHPAPPSPTENETSKESDAELLLTGNHIRGLNQPCVVCGDMNDVVWSRTTRLFRKMTEMIDPREGRGFFSTYHAGYQLMRFPLDHIFISTDLYVDKMERTNHFGSDHFGMYYEIHHRAGNTNNTKGKLNSTEKKNINEMIEDGKDNAKNNDN